MILELPWRFFEVVTLFATPAPDDDDLGSSVDKLIADTTAQASVGVVFTRRS